MNLLQIILPSLVRGALTAGQARELPKGHVEEVRSVGRLRLFGRRVSVHLGLEFTDEPQGDR